MTQPSIRTITYHGRELPLVRAAQADFPCRPQCTGDEHATVMYFWPEASTEEVLTECALAHPEREFLRALRTEAEPVPTHYLPVRPDGPDSPDARLSTRPWLVYWWWAE